MNELFNKNNPRYVVDKRHDKTWRYVNNVLDENGWKYRDVGKGVYTKLGMPYELIMLNLSPQQIPVICEKDGIAQPAEIRGKKVYAMALVQNDELLRQILYLNKVRSENTPGGIYPRRDRLKVRIDGNEYMELPMLISDKGPLLGLGILDMPEHVLPVSAFNETLSFEDLIESPRMAEAMETIMLAEMEYAQVLKSMRAAAEILQDTYHDGSQIAVHGAVSAPTSDGRKAIAKPLFVGCMDRAPLIDRNIYLASRVMTPYWDATLGERPIDEVPQYLMKTSKENITADVDAAIKRIQRDVIERSKMSRKFEGKYGAAESPETGALSNPQGVSLNDLLAY